MAENEAVFSFHRSLYLPEAVKAAVEAYGGHCESAEVTEGDYEVTVTLRGYDPRYGDAFGDAFANHALFETVVRTRETLGGVPV